MKTILRRGGPSRLFGGRLKTTFFRKVKGILRGTPPEIASDSCYRMLEDNSNRLLEDGGFRLLEDCPSDTSNILDNELDFIL